MTRTELIKSKSLLPCGCSDDEIAVFKIATNKWTCEPKPTGGTSSCVVYYTRTALVSLRNSGGLDPSCHYVVTDYSRGNVTAQILLHAVTDSSLSMSGHAFTQYDNSAWECRYDIDTNRLTYLADNLDNEVTGQAAVDTFPWGNTGVYDNRLLGNAVLTYLSGTMHGNTLNSNSVTRVDNTNFINNIVDTDANVTVSGTSNVQRNHFQAQSNTTVSAGDFLENVVANDATVTSSTTGDVDNNNFGGASTTNILGGNFDTNNVESSANVRINSGQVQRNRFGEASNTTINGGNFDNNTVMTDANVTVTTGTVNMNTFKASSNTSIIAGIFTENTVGQDAQVTIRSSSNYENTFGDSVVYNQVGAGYIRYSSILGSTTWTNGNTNVSNVTAHTSTVNTTGSIGTIFNSTLDRAYMQACQDVPSFTVTDCTVSNYGAISCNNAARLYFYRSTCTDGSRILISTGSRIDASHTNLDSYSYLQSTGNGGFLRANYCTLSSLGYIRNNTVNSNFCDRVHVTSQASVRFDSTANNCRVYYSSAHGGGAIYHTTGSNNCYIYYGSVDSLGQMYTQNSTDARMYYCNADSRGYVRTLNSAGSSHMYYCDASASSYVQINGARGRMYAVSATSQSIVEKTGGGTGGNVYYSSFSAYYYAYITRNAGTSSGLYGMGRRSFTITNPVNIAPYALGASWQNF